MNLIEKISSTLKTWVFKKKLLAFSTRFPRDAQACFYCPEMCRFSCPVAETLRFDTVTPRGKMSLLHWQDRGESIEKVAGSEENADWLFDQCTGCGRCTEYCVHEVDVASNLRDARASRAISVENLFGESDFLKLNQLRSKKILIVEQGRLEWWKKNSFLVSEIGAGEIIELQSWHHLWSEGKLSSSMVEKLRKIILSFEAVWVESPGFAWFLQKEIFENEKNRQGVLRLVWQELWGDFSNYETRPGQVVHESWHLTRLLPRANVSIPMYERGLMPFHSGWNVIDCGGEGFYKKKYPDQAEMMKRKFYQDLKKDGREINEIICQSLECVSHLKGLGVNVSYWLDKIH